MADKLKLSTHSSDQLNYFSTRLNIKRNLVCRIAFSISINEGEPVSGRICSDSDGYEFNKSTIIGPDETLFRALSAYVQNKSMGEDFFNIYVRNHIERGLEKMFVEYQSINSPVTFLSSLIS